MYTSKHNYDLLLDTTVPESEFSNPVWHKLTMFENAIASQKYDWLWWLDFDTLITNTSIPLHTLIPKFLHNHPSPSEIAFLLTADCFPLNAGSMIMRSSPLLTNLISSVRQCGRDHPDKNEQDCIKDILYKTELGKKHALWVPQDEINAFSPEIPCYDEGGSGWRVGRFVVHFAGAWAHLHGYKDVTGMLMRKYAVYVDDTTHEIGWAPERETTGTEVPVKEE